jgi:cation diffusion facilitator CzcD-associated flavoprotein CzcO
MKKTRVLILGGGFGGVYTALEFEKRRDADFEITMIVYSDVARDRGERPGSHSHRQSDAQNIKAC